MKSDGKGGEQAGRKVVGAEVAQSLSSGSHLPGVGGAEEADSIVESGQDYPEAGDIGLKVEVQFRRDPADVTFDVPNGLAGAAVFAENGDVVGIGLRVVAQDKAQESCFTRTIGAEQSPALARLDNPIEIVKDGRLSVADGDV